MTSRNYFEPWNEDCRYALAIRETRMSEVTGIYLRGRPQIPVDHLAEVIDDPARKNGGGNRLFAYTPDGGNPFDSLDAKDPVDDLDFVDELDDSGFRFLSALGAGAPSNAYLHMRAGWRWQGQERSNRAWFHPTHSWQAATWALQETHRRRNVFISWGAFAEPVNAAKVNVRGALSFLGDLDVGPGKQFSSQDDARRHVCRFEKRHGLHPTAVASSGFGVQVWLMLTEMPVGEDWLERWARVSEWIRGELRSDPGLSPAENGLARLPSSFNCKKSTPRKAEILDFDPSAKLSLEEYESFVPRSFVATRVRQPSRSRSALKRQHLQPKHDQQGSIGDDVIASFDPQDLGSPLQEIVMRLQWDFRLKVRDGAPWLLLIGGVCPACRTHPDSSRHLKPDKAYISISSPVCQ